MDAKMRLLKPKRHSLSCDKDSLFLPSFCARLSMASNCSVLQSEAGPCISNDSTRRMDSEGTTQCYILVKEHLTPGLKKKKIEDYLINFI